MVAKVESAGAFVCNECGLVVFGFEAIVEAFLAANAHSDVHEKKSTMIIKGYKVVSS